MSHEIQQPPSPDPIQNQLALFGREQEKTLRGLNVLNQSALQRNPFTPTDSVALAFGYFDLEYTARQCAWEAALRTEELSAIQKARDAFDKVQEIKDSREAGVYSPLAEYIGEYTTRLREMADRNSDPVIERIADRYDKARDVLFALDTGFSLPIAEIQRRRTPLD